MQFSDPDLYEINLVVKPRDCLLEAVHAMLVSIRIERKFYNISLYGVYAVSIVLCS